jgi:hypothetical protein
MKATRLTMSPADVSADGKAADQRAAALEIVRREAARSGRTVRSILSVVRMVSRRVSRNGSCLHPSGCFDPRT